MEVNTEDQVLCISLLLVFKIINACSPIDHVALLWIGATDFGRAGNWEWSQSKKSVDANNFNQALY